MNSKDSLKEIRHKFNTHRKRTKSYIVKHINDEYISKLSFKKLSKHISFLKKLEKKELNLCNKFFVKKVVHLQNNNPKFNNKLLQKVNTNYINMKNIIFQKFDTPILFIEKYKNNFVSQDSENIEDIENTQEPQKYALVIGINYKNSIYQLNGCINDAKNLITFLTNNEGYLDENITLLTDESIIKPTYNNIIHQLKKIISKAKKNDKIFIGYSGHGNFVIDKNNDEIDNKDECIFTLDKKIIKDDLLCNLFKRLDPLCSLFCLFDCCHSGTMLDLKFNIIDANNNNQLTTYQNNNKIKSNTITISGCTDKQESMDSIINKKWQGALTWSFLESMYNKNKYNIDNWITLVENMRILLKKNDFYQIPQLCSSKNDVNSIHFFNV